MKLKRKPKSKYSFAFCCNDCDRGFSNQAAWEHHGMQTGHNINGDLPGKQQQELDEAYRRIDKLEQAYKIGLEECAKRSMQLDAIRNILQLYV